MNGIKRVDVVKIDIEGSELDAFVGMQETFDICPPWLIVCELAPLAAPVGHSVEPKVSGRRRSYQVQIIEFLAAKGYEPRYISEKDGRLGDPVNPRDMEGMSEDILNVAFIRRNLTSTRPDLFFRSNGRREGIGLA